MGGKVAAWRSCKREHGTARRVQDGRRERVVGLVVMKTRKE
jgi:hypothetical protein